MSDLWRGLVAGLGVLLGVILAQTLVEGLTELWHRRRQPDLDKDEEDLDAFYEEQDKRENDHDHL